jgi:hypothetical protein
MAKKIRTKFMAVILTLAMVIRLMPALTLPAKALDSTTLTLGSPSFSDSASYIFPDLAATSDQSIGTVIISADTEADSGDTITLPSDTTGIGGAPTVLTDINELTKTVIFASAQSASAVQAYLRDIVFNVPKPSQSRRTRIPPR